MSLSLALGIAVVPHLSQNRTEHNLHAIRLKTSPAIKLAVFDFANDQAGYNFYSYDLMLGEKQDRFETFEREYTTPNGETIVAFGYYGNDY